MPSEQVKRLYEIGTTVQFKCTYDLQSLISKLDYVTPRSANRFYELFLVDYNGDLIDVPVLITNI